MMALWLSVGIEPMTHMKTRKELLEEYKQMKPIMGVYSITNTTNGKKLVEGSINIAAIWNRSRFELNNGTHANTGLQKDWTMLGEDAFSFEILSEISEDKTRQLDYKHEVKQLEDLFVEELQPFGDRGYNNQAMKCEQK
jgi:hypothetical protein